MTVTEIAASAAAAAPRPGCAHCGLPMPAGSGSESFCCAGCRAAWEVLHACGLERFYTLPERRLAAVAPSGRTFEEFDHEAFQRLHARARPGGAREIDFYLEGIHCASCVWLIERLPRMVPGLARVELDLGRRLARVSWDPGRVPLSRVARALDSLGYRPHPFRGGRGDAVRRAEDRAMLGRLGLAAALASNVMLLAVALYAGGFKGMEARFEHYFRWLSLGLTTVSVLGPGRTFFRGALSSFRARALHMDVPIALALLAGWARGAWNTATGSGPIYFDGVAMLVFLLLVGRYLLLRAQRGSADATALLGSLTPSTARVVEGGAVREAPAEALLPGMVVEVRGGETVPADGVVLEGRTSIDRSLLSGESRPVAADPGDPVWSGSINRGPRFTLRVLTAGEESRLGRLLREVEAGAARRAPVVRLADRLAGAFVAAVLTLAAITAIAGWDRDPSDAIDRAIALLIVTCPCALALATPLAITAAIGRAARAGILIRGGDALELLARPARVVLDKTGTLTEGRVALERWEEFVPPARAVRGLDPRRMVLALEAQASHPLAEGFRRAWPGLEFPEATGVIPTIGGGLEGDVLGHRVAVGSPAFIAARLAPGPAPRAAGDSGALTPVWVAIDGRLAACAGFGDPVRPEAARVLASLRQRGDTLELLSGDCPAVVDAVGTRLGFAADARRGGATPEDKLRRVEELLAGGGRRRRPVVFVGDGVNDAAAMARADVGVGVHGSAEACLATADVYLSRPGLAGLQALVEGARRTLGVIRLDVALSLIYNVAGAALAMTGVINPLIAAILMPVSSLTVVMVSWRARTFAPAPGAAAPDAGAASPDRAPRLRAERAA